VFLKVLNELQGYYGDQGYNSLASSTTSDKRGAFVISKETYLLPMASNWENDREGLFATVTQGFLFARAYAEQFSTAPRGNEVIGEAQGRGRLSDRRLC